VVGKKEVSGIAALVKAGEKIEKELGYLHGCRHGTSK
jgi:hypothetical protein